MLLAAGAAAFAIPLPRRALGLVADTCAAAQALTGRPLPCLDLKLAASGRPGYAVLRAPGYHTQILVMPTAAVPGIEAAVLKEADGAEYWRAALEAREFVRLASGRPSLAGIGLSINSMQTRSQDHLHIHAGCYKPEVLARLRAAAPTLSPSWRLMPRHILGARFYARTLTRAELAEVNPFRLLAELPGTGGDISNTTAALVGLDPREETFVLLGTRPPPRNSERLFDDACADGA